MRIDYFDSFRVIAGPLENHTTLIVDPYTMICRQVSLESLKAIAWWSAKIEKLMGCIQQIELSSSDRPKCLRHSSGSFGVFTVEDILGSVVAEV
jgi:hypothetical protein